MWPDLDLGELVFGSQNIMPDEANGINNAVSCYKELVQLVLHCPIFDNICRTAMNFVFFFVWVTN